MTVSELIAFLAALPQHLPVWFIHDANNRLQIGDIHVNNHGVYIHGRTEDDKE